MREIRELPPNGYTVVSTFSGAGGSCLGFRMAGFRIVYANEFVEAARNTYEANADPRTLVDSRDIRQVTGQEILRLTGLAEVDVLEGSPPCQAFSSAGKRDAGWGKVAAHADGSVQRSDDLFFEFARVLGELRPRMFVAENVSGLAKGRASGMLREIMQALRRQGYAVEARLLNAARLGVPQDRERVIFVGVREDQDTQPRFPAPMAKLVTLREAIGGKDEARLSRGEAKLLSEKQAMLYHRTIPGKSFSDAAKAMTGKASWFNYRRLAWGKPSPTLMVSPCALHPDVPRSLTASELRRVGSFPDDFELVGTYEEQHARVGNAVPPLMMRAVAEAVREMLREADRGSRL